MTLRITLPQRAVSKARWSEIGRRLEKARASRLHHLTSALTMRAGASSIFGTWDVTTRHSILLALEHAFLDPDGSLRKIGSAPEFRALSSHEALALYVEQIRPKLTSPRVRRTFGDLLGKLRSFRDLGEVDWVIDLNELRKGSPGAALTKFQDTYRTSMGDQP